MLTTAAHTGLPYNQPGGSPMTPLAGPGLGWSMVSRVPPSPGCANCVKGLGTADSGISSGLTILGLLAVAAIAFTVVNYVKK